MFNGDVMAMLAAGGTLIVLLVGAGIAWGVNRKGLSTLTDSHVGLKKEFITHKDDKTIHRDPIRDPKAEQDFRTSVAQNFALVHETLQKIDKRCENRGKVCAADFSKLGKRLAIITHDVNGGSDD